MTPPFSDTAPDDADDGGTPVDDQPRDHAPAARGWPRWKAIALLSLVGVALASPLWAPLVMRRMDFFRLRHVEVVGVKYVSAEALEQVIQIDTNTMSVWDPLSPMVERVAAHPVVLDVNIRRKLPGTLVVAITERVPVALVANPDGFRIYDERGVALPIDPTRAPVDAPVVDRPDTALFRLLAEVRLRLPDLYARLSEVLHRRGEEGRGTALRGATGVKQASFDELLFRLDTIPVRAMANVTIERLAELHAVEADLGRRGAHPREFDLRYKDQVIARIQ